ncbi:MAG: hypothetical protein GDA36_03175 [Rhodobacteraceae bacterium]|nr:hypothetical protein [Paracoccaceae bacterium]
MTASVPPPPIYAESENVAKVLCPLRPQQPDALKRVREARNAGWADNPIIPNWVDPKTVDLDRFFTRQGIARKCHESLLQIMAGDHADTRQYRFVDPSAGEGVFYDLLPHGRRIGIEIVPERLDFECKDFLEWAPRENGHRYAVIGNPPFGYRAWLALAFVNHAAVFADYIGMILPMGFQSNGKGSPKFRVRGAQLVSTMSLPPDAFISPEGKTVNVNALWQVWRRGVNNRQPIATCNEWVDLFTIDHRKERLCGQDRLHDADWLLQRTFYGDPPTLVTDFANVRYGCGYGIVIKKDKWRVVAALRSADWHKHSNLAAHNCRHISMEHIRAALVEAGFVDAA